MNTRARRSLEEILHEPWELQIPCDRRRPKQGTNDHLDSPPNPTIVQSERGNEHSPRKGPTVVQKEGEPSCARVKCEGKEKRPIVCFGRNNEVWSHTLND